MYNTKIEEIRKLVSTIANQHRFVEEFEDLPKGGNNIGDKITVVGKDPIETYVWYSGDWHVAPENTSGADGKSAFEIAVENGFVGTEVEWLTTLIGPKGPQGEIGPQGIQGEKGDTGDQGIQGERGPKGDTGEQGIQGPAGIDGVNGIDGVDGVSAYQAAVAGGFVGPETEYNSALASVGDLSSVLDAINGEVI